jgi:hypothetical protein
VNEEALAHRRAVAPKTNKQISSLAEIQHYKKKKKSFILQT